MKSTALADSVQFKHADVRYASTAFQFDNSGGTIDSSTLQQIGNYGMEIIGSANPTITNSEFININNTGIYMSMFANPAFSNNLTSNVKYNAIRIRPETWSQTDTVPIRSFAGYDSITYLFPYAGSVLVSSGTTITVPAGVVFKQQYKYPNSSSYGNPLGFRVDGTLHIEGTEEHPVVFTHINDDKYGNPADTELNGNLTNETNTNGNWIQFNSGADDASTVRHALMRNFFYGFRLKSASPVIDSCTLSMAPTACCSKATLLPR